MFFLDISVSNIFNIKKHRIVSNCDISLETTNDANECSKHNFDRSIIVGEKNDILFIAETINDNATTTSDIDAKSLLVFCSAKIFFLLFQFRKFRTYKSIN